MIKAVIFDVGGVLVTTIMQPMSKDFAEKYGKGYDFFYNAMKTKWMDYKLGKIGMEEFWNAFSEKSGIEMAPEELEKLSQSYVGEMPGVMGIVKRLKKNYRVAILSNNVETWVQKTKDTVDTGLFEFFISSHDVEAAKPDKKIFDICLEKLGLKAEECVFIDDQQNNFEASGKYGFNSIRFENAEQLENDLKKLGVEL